VQRVDDLLVVAGAQRRDDQPCVSPRVNSAEPWVRGRTEVWQSIGRTCPARARRSGGRFDHVGAQDVRLELLQRGAEVRVFQLLFAQRGLDRLFRGGHGVLTLQLVGDGIGGAHLLASPAAFTASKARCNPAG
jgi:hypothetical protein